MRTVVTAGHVDHGKSTLVRALTGMEPDRLAEERRRGLSIELGFAWCELGSAPVVTVAFVDVPGHERFLPTMLAGAGPAPHALFVVAADQGWQAQTQEHLEVLDLLDVPVVAAVVTRTGLAGRDRTDEVVRLVRTRLAARGRDVPVLAADAVDGAGLDELRSVLAEQLAAAPPPPDRDLPRLWLDRVFTLKGVGTVVTGTLQGGRLAAGTDVRLLPGDRRARIRGLQSLGRDITEASPGDRVAVNLAGVDMDAVERGGMLVTQAVRVTDEFDAVVDVLPGHEVAVTGAWRLHVGTASVPVRVRPTTGRSIEERGAARLRLATPLPLLSGDRFVLRDEGRRATVAGGVAVDVWPGAPPRGADARAQHETALLAIADAPHDRRLDAFLALTGGVAHRDRVRGLPSDPRSQAAPRAIGSYVASGAAQRAWSDAVAGHLRAHESAGRTELADVLTARGCPPNAVDAVLSALEQGGSIARRGPAYVASRGADRFDAEARRRRDALVARLAASPFAPPPLDEAARQLGATTADVQSLLHDKRIFRHAGMAFAREAVEQAVTVLVDLERREGPFTAGRAKQALGTTRKYAIPLLELIDGLGFTRSDGNLRRVVRPVSRR